MSEQPKRLVTTVIAAREVGVSRSTLARWVAEGYIEPAAKTIKGHFRWDIERLHAELEQLGSATQ